MSDSITPDQGQHMKRFSISNTLSGVDLGTYEAETKEQALDLMAQDAGCADYASLDAQIPSKPGEIIVTEV